MALHYIVAAACLKIDGALAPLASLKTDRASLRAGRSRVERSRDQRRANAVDCERPLAGNF